MAMVIVFFVTSADSGAMVVDTLASGGVANTPVWQRIFWASLMGVVAIALLDEIINNITTSPLSYFLAFIGAFIWAAYCTVTNKYARGFNGITVFVLLTGASLWVYYFLTPQPEMVFSTPVMIKLISAAFTLGFAYAAWNVGLSSV